MKFLDKILFEKSLKNIKNESIKKYFLTFFNVKQILTKLIVFLVLSLIIASISFTIRNYALNKIDPSIVMFNPGVAFSGGAKLGSGFIIALQAVPIALSFIAFIFINNIYLYLPLTFVYVGGSCNLIDRFIADNGHINTVVDYIPGIGSVFNFPDIIIVTGSATFVFSCLMFLIITSVKESKKEKNKNVNN